MADKSGRRSALIMADIEGIAGIHDKRQCKPYTPEWTAARELMTADVNAAIAGLQDAGVAEITIRDMHGPGYNLLPGRLPAGVRCIQGHFWKPVPLIGEVGRPECAVMIGWHAGPDQSDGFSPHIFHRRVRALKINGSPITEVELFSAALGELDIPVLLVSGDNAATERIAGNMPWIKKVEVPKRHLSGEELAEMRQTIRSSVARALSGALPKPLVWKTHLVELTTPEGTKSWLSASALETLSTVLQRTYFKGVPAAFLTVLLHTHRFRSRCIDRRIKANSR